MTVPSFGPEKDIQYKRLPVDFAYMRDEKREVQRFNLLDKPISIGTVNQAVKATRANTDDAEGLAVMIDIIAGYMDNRDGTGVHWKPIELPAKKGEDPPVKRFRGPDGRLHAWDKADGFLAVDKGSSRRRWLHLMNEDNGAEVDQEALVKLLEYLMEIAGKDRTRA